jgi:hypothetical protein
VKRIELIIDVHEPGDADSPVGMVRYERGRVVWRCLLCQERDDLALGLGHGVDRLLDHLETDHG